MENYHLFVVDEVSLKYHIEYGFVGTGNTKSNFHIGLWKDIARLKINDIIIFYVQKTKKFYGFFKVKTLPFYDSNHYLQPNPLPFLGKKNIKLKYRALIKPYIVFPEGIDEFELIDILPQETKNVLWSILYRKLKANRGCSPIFSSEFQIIYDRLFSINNGNYLDNRLPLTFSNSKISYCNSVSPVYNINSIINPFIKLDIINLSYTEHHLHAVLLEFLPSQIFQNIQWLGNEVYAGAGMQAIDILFIDDQEKYNIIEIKKEEISNGITKQIEKYIYWLQHRFQNFSPLLYQPIIIGKRIEGKQKFHNRVNEFKKFNNLGLSLPIKYFEYDINRYRNRVAFYEINYNSEFFYGFNIFFI